LEISRVISVPSWNEATAGVAADYWRSRGFTSVHLESGPKLRGRRGSDLGSFFPYFFWRSGAGFWDVDWKRIWTSLKIAPGEFGGVQVDMEVAPGGGLSRRVTEWGPAFFRLEIAELEHLLNGAGDLEEVWGRFTEAERKGTALWLWTKKAVGLRLSEDWEAEILELEAAFLLAGEDST
jgi:hypothetical protein